MDRWAGMDEMLAAAEETLDYAHAEVGAWERRADAAEAALRDATAERDRLRDSLRFPPTWTQSRAAAELERLRREHPAAEAALRDERALADAIAADLLSEFSEQTCMRKPGFAAWRARRGSEPT